MNTIPPFELERYFARYEFQAPYLLSPSDVDSLSLAEVLALADAEGRELWEHLSLGYTESQGLPLLRQEIAGLYSEIDANQVLVLAPEEGIFIAMHTLLEPGDEVIALLPAYQSLHEIARWRGCHVTPWPVQLVDGQWRVDLPALERAITPRTRLLVINFPHNPTGCLPTQDEQRHILGLAQQHGLWVFSDEMYRLMEYDPAQRLPAVCDLYERGISLSGMSKTFALPGLRIGWLTTRSEDLVQQWLALKDYTTICNSAPSEILALMGLRARQRIVQRSLEIVGANLRLAEAFFERHPQQLRWIPPQAGSIAFPQWTGQGSVEAFAQTAVEQHGVMITPGSLFGLPAGMADNHFRIGLGRKNLPDALKRLEGIF